MKNLISMTITKNSILTTFLIILITLIVSATIFYGTKQTSTPKVQYCVLIDAGHGGIDGGVVGYSGKTKESDLNLKYSMCLGEYFEGLNCKVVYTRSNENGLYSEFATNKKVDDMKKREQIIKDNKPDLVISIHQNGYVLPDQRGITAFYKINHNASRELANCIQNRFKEKLEYARSEALEGDYYILNCSNTTSVLIECGFLTNPDDEILLTNIDYMNKVCHEIFSACVLYLLEADILK